MIRELSTRELAGSRRSTARLTICDPHPRPAPMMIWKPIQVPAELVGVSVDSNPMPIAVKIPLAMLQGR